MPHVRFAPVLALLLVVLVAAPYAAAKDEKPKPHDDKQVAEAFARFESEYASEDMDRRLRILKWLGRWQHKDVYKRLKKILLKERDAELQAVAAEGLGWQRPTAKEATKTLHEALVKFRKYGSRLDPKTPELQAANHDEEKVLVAAIESLTNLYPFHKRRHKNDGWKELKKLVDHNSDPVAIAFFKYCAATKEFRAIPVLLEWFNFYPDGYSWAGASAKVDTGTAGNKDQKAARAKALGKANARRKKVRPEAWEAMVETVKSLTGKEMKKPAELKAWMKENKIMLKKHGV